MERKEEEEEEEEEKKEKDRFKVNEESLDKIGIITRYQQRNEVGYGELGNLKRKTKGT